MSDRVRSLKRGLDILMTLNLHNGCTLPFVADQTGLNRGTVYRMLLTLQDEGFVRRDEHEHYWLCGKVQTLADGYHDERWIDEIVKPAINKLAEEVLWPVSLVTPSGINMHVRATTDHISPLTVYLTPPGWRNPIAGSFAGRVYLAYCDERQRETVLDLICTSSTDPRDDIARNRDEFRRILDGIRRKGFAYGKLEEREFVYVVPVLTQNRYLASLSVRILDNAMRPAAAIKKILPSTKETARAIGAQFNRLVT